MAGATFWADSFLPRPATLFLRSLAGVFRRRAARTLGSILKRSAAGSLAFGLGDGFAVFVSELVELSLAPTGGDPGDEDGRDRAQRRVVVLALDHDESVVALGQRRVDVSGMIGCHVEGLAQAGVTGLGDALAPVHQSGLVDLGHKAGEGAHAGEVGEAVEVARVAQDGRREDGPESRGRATMPLGSASS